MITKLNIDRIEKAYKESQGYRELKKWAFSLATFGLGALYLWADTQVVRKGEIGLRQTLKGDWILLPPGRHSNFPWESSPVNPQSLSKKLIEMGPYKIFIVETGFVGQTSEGGKLRIVNEPGQYLIDEAAHTFDGLISIKQETKKLHTVVASTSDNVAVTLQADVRYQIEDPEQALRQIDNIEDSIKEMAEISISQIVSHHTLNDFAPALLPSAADKATGITKVIHELMEKVREQLSSIGIKLLNIGLTSWSINDKELAHELAQGAVIKSQTQSKFMAAENAAQVRAIEATAESNAITTKADAIAEANKKIGASYRAIADMLQDSPGGQKIYDQHLQKEIVANAQNANIFYGMPLATQGGNQINLAFSPLDSRP